MVKQICKKNLVILVHVIAPYFGTVHIGHGSKGGGFHRIRRIQSANGGKVFEQHFLFPENQYESESLSLESGIIFIP